MTDKERAFVEKEFNNVSSLLLWSKRFLSIGGIWPLDKTYKRATIWTVYLTFHLIMEYAELLAVFGDLEMMVLSVLESVMQSMVYAKLFVFRYSIMLRHLIHAIIEDLKDDYYDSWEEKKIYLEYNALAKLFYKISMPYIIVAASLYYLRPILTYYVIMPLITESSNFTFLVLPFQLTTFIPIETTQSYFIMYGYLSPMVYLLVCHNAWICLLITMVLHICGQLAVLNHRIKKILVDIDEDKVQIIFRRLVRRHMRSVWMAKTLDDTFHFVLLIDLVGTTLLLGLMSYIVIIGSSMSESSFGYIYIICIIATAFLIYGYCVVGECLLNELYLGNERLMETVPCSLTSNLRTSSSNLATFFRRVHSPEVAKWFAHWQNCDINSVKALRKYYQRPYFFSSTVSPAHFNWVLMSSDYNSPSYKRVEIDSGLIALAQLRGATRLRLTSINSCNSSCPELIADLHRGEMRQYKFP